MAQMYDFQKQLHEGQKHERYLDSQFERIFYIVPASREEERVGIDRHFMNKKSGHYFTVQYKADRRAASTGNAFVEIVSVDTANTPGWAITCTADYIVYYVVGLGPAYIIRPTVIKKQLSRWERQYAKRNIPNDGYNTIGLLVPLDEFERLAEAVIDL